jgi:hypothetical protein
MQSQSDPDVLADSMSEDATVTMPAAVDPFVGQTINERFVITALVGRGGMGNVFRAKQLGLSRQVAIKVLKPETVNDDVIRRFDQEAKAASKLSHPNIVGIYDFGVTADGAPYIAMELLEGESLAERIKTCGRLPVSEALAVFIQICGALAHAHAAGIVHRDLKPGNVSLSVDKDGQWTAKLVDFGIAKMMQGEGAGQDLTKTGEIIGSPLYMSPEQCRGNELDARSDIYSLGCLMYEALAGRTPFKGENPMQTLLMHLQEQPQPLSSSSESAVNAKLNTVVLACLEKDPINRYQSANELLQDLLRIYEGERLKKKQEKRLPYRKLLVVLLALVGWLGVALLVPGYVQRWQAGITAAKVTELLEQAKSEVAKKQWSAAEKYDQQAFEQARDDRQRLEARLDLSTVYHDENKHLLASSTLEEAAGLARKMGNSSVAQNALVRAAYSLILEKKYLQAQVILSGLEQELVHTGNDHSLIMRNVLDYLMRAYYWQENYQLSAKYARKCIAICQITHLQDLGVLRSSYYFLASSEANLEDYANALKDVNTGLDFVRLSEHPPSSFYQTTIHLKEKIERAQRAQKTNAPPNGRHFF